MKAILKPAGLLALLAGYALLGGFDGGEILWQVTWVLIFTGGAIITLWMGNKPVGDLRPISFRALYVLGGTLLMIWAVFMMITTKDLLGKKGRGKVPAAKRAHP